MKPLFFILLFLLTSCDPKEDSRTLPPITTTGENTFGCYVNGVLVTPRDGPAGLNSQPAKGMKIASGNSIDKVEYHEIRVRDWKSGTRGIVRIYFEPALYKLGAGTYTVQSNREDTPNGKPIVLLTIRLHDEWYNSIAGTGEVNLLRVDSVNRIVSGTFSCEAVADPNNRIKITEGRFDININTLNNTLFH